MIRAVVFDLDDTLAPEYGFVKSGFKAVASFLAEGKWLRFKVPEGSDAAALTQQLWRELLELFDEDARNVFNRLLELHGVADPGDDIFDLVKLYRDHEIDPEIYRPYSDAMPALDRLKKEGIKLGILTDGFALSQRNKLRTLGFDKDLFDSILVTAEKGEGYAKPSEKGFLHVAGELGIDPSEMIYVGDNPKKDFYIGQLLPVKTMRVMRKGGVYENAPYREDIKEDFRIEDLGQIYAYIRGIEE